MCCINSVYIVIRTIGGIPPKKNFMVPTLLRGNRFLDAPASGVALTLAMPIT